MRAFDLPCLEQGGFEADDLIATYVRLACEAGATATIVSSDKDLMQLVNDGVIMYDTMKDRRIGIPEVIEKFGVPPDKVIEVQALIGDSTDNVPGVPGIGVKTAAQLIGEYGDLETLLARAGEIKQEKRRQTLIDNADKARLSKQLVTLDANVKLDVPVGDLAVHDPDYKKLIAFLKAMEFNTLTRRVAEFSGVDAAEIEPDEKLRVGGPQASLPLLGEQAGGHATPGEGKSLHAAPPPPALPRGRRKGARAPRQAPPPRNRWPTRVSRPRAARRSIARNMRRSARAIASMRGSSARARPDIWRSIPRPPASIRCRRTLCGFSLAVSDNEACYVPLAHRHGGDGTGLFAGERAADQIEETQALAALKPLLEDPGVLKIGQNIKFDWQIFAQRGIETAPDRRHHADVLRARRRQERARHGRAVGALAPAQDHPLRRGCGHRQGADLLRPGADRQGDRIRGRGRRRDAAAVGGAQAAARRQPHGHRLRDARAPAGRGARPHGAARHLDRPPGALAPLRRVRPKGRRARGRDQEAGRASRSIPGSPKQLGDILFGKMGLPGGKKTKTGAWSTSASVLEDLAEQGNELSQKILDWRQVSKLRSTYTDALPGFVNPRTHRVHTGYALAATTTGRLSSSEPNLQNIPIRTEEGRKIRRAFIADPGFKLVSADYSQIELRLLAEIADIAALKQAFRDGLDIHAMTASEMFGVPVEGMPGEVRRRAKAINFGIIYGISAFGLANQLGIAREEAGAYIKKYFERFPGIRDYMEASKEFCRKHGYVTTLFGRKCHYPDIVNSNASIRAFNERAAINARLQGTAADIIRRAMIRMEDALAKKKLGARCCCRCMTSWCSRCRTTRSPRRFP